MRLSQRYHVRTGRGRAAPNLLHALVTTQDILDRIYKVESLMCLSVCLFVSYARLHLSEDLDQIW